MTDDWTLLLMCVCVCMCVSCFVSQIRQNSSSPTSLSFEHVMHPKQLAVKSVQVSGSRCPGETNGYNGCHTDPRDLPVLHFD